MSKVNRLPPRGRDEAQAAAEVLSAGRYVPTPDAEPAPAPALEPKPGPTVGTAKPVPPAKKKSRRGRADAEGMTRRTYYMRTVDADDVENAVNRIYAQLHELVPKHRIFRTILTMGLDHVDDVAQRLKDELRAGLD
jgi:hypothetical protein